MGLGLCGASFVFRRLANTQTTAHKTQRAITDTRDEGRGKGSKEKVRSLVPGLFSLPDPFPSVFLLSFLLFLSPLYSLTFSSFLLPLPNTPSPQAANANDISINVLSIHWLFDIV